MLLITTNNIVSSKVILLILFGLLLFSIPQAQVLTTEWKNSGVRKDYIFPSTNTLNILNLGADNSGNNSCNAILNAAISSLSLTGGVIHFPSGIYLFDKKIDIKHSNIVLKGIGSDVTTLRFNLGSINNSCINVFNNSSSNDTTKLIVNAKRGTKYVSVFNSSKFSIGDWVSLNFNDSLLITSNWAKGTVSQLLKVTSIVGNKLYFDSPLRMNYLVMNNSTVRKFHPVEGVGIECLKIVRVDNTNSQTSNIKFTNVVNSWIKGVESSYTNYSHLELNKSSNIYVSGCYFHHAFSYGTGGKGYGVTLQFSSGECLIENNIFSNLRHSILLQAGSNGNAICYNYSKDPFWTEPFMPSNSSGDIVLHGNYPFFNLFEGNINQTTVIDNSHGINGPYNTFLRNRSELYGFSISNNPPNDTCQIIGNEVVGGVISIFNITGSGNYTQYNNVNGNITPINSSSVLPISYIYKVDSLPLCYDESNFSIPNIGPKSAYTFSINLAKHRCYLGQFTNCSCNMNSTIENNSNINNIKLYPNPASEVFMITGVYSKVEILDFSGQNIKTLEMSDKYHIKELNAGIYIIRVFVEGQSNLSSINFKLIKI